jgi:DNA-binding CsgD family transcriptional regulator
VLEVELASDLLPTILEGAFETPLWASFLEGLRRKTGADYASLIFRPPGRPLNAVVHLFAGDPSPPLVQQLYHEDFYQRDPLPYHQLADGRPYPLEELLRFDEPDHVGFYRDVVVPSGMAAMRMMRVQEASGVNAWLTIARRRADFEAPANDLLSAIAPALRGALRNFVALERERFNASVAAEAIRRLHFGWFTLDAAGRVLESDALGADILSMSAILRRSANGRLSARRAELDREIVQAIRDLAADPRSRPRAITLSRDPWLDMLLVPTHSQPISAKPGPAVIAYVHGDSSPSADRCEQLGQLFALTPSEARLALALSRGMTIAEAAVEFGLTLETARNYSKKIYSKTGARGQPDLVRFVMRSVLAIA